MTGRRHLAAHDAHLAALDRHTEALAGRVDVLVQRVAALEHAMGVVAVTVQRLTTPAAGGGVVAEEVHPDPDPDDGPELADAPPATPQSADELLGTPAGFFAAGDHPNDDPWNQGRG